LNPFQLDQGEICWNHRLRYRHRHFRKKYW